MQIDLKYYDKHDNHYSEYVVPGMIKG